MASTTVVKITVALIPLSLGLLAALSACSSHDPSQTSAGGGGDGGAGAAGSSSSSASSSQGGGGAGMGGGMNVAEAMNPVLGIDHPDPHVLRTLGPDGKPIYYLTSTIDSGGDIPIFTSTDLIHWSPEPKGAFHRTNTPGSSLAINQAHFCSIWAPEIEQLGPSTFLLAFTATRFASPQAKCPPYNENSGVYLAYSSSPLGPFAPMDHPWEPFPAGANEASCPANVRLAIPRSVDYASDDCQGTFCSHIIRLDSDVLRDEVTGRSWMAYAWYTNSPPKVAWEQTNHGEHVHIVELDAADPFAVQCNLNVAQIYAANPHDAATVSALEKYCDRCGEMLSMRKGRFDEDIVRDGAPWAIVEGPSLFRRGGYVYLMLSGSAWDSAYYHVYWTAAPTVEELAYDNPARIVGRYLIPSLGQSFGHGTAVLGPDGEQWYFVHHRLTHAPCAAAGNCARDVWVSPIEFEDRGDGKGDVYIKPRFPAEEPGIQVILP